MNMKRFNIILLLAVMGFLLAACTGAGTTNAWAGALISEKTIYFADTYQVYALREDNGNVIWKYPEKAGKTRMFFSEPVLAGDQLIVGDYGKLLTSLNPADGSENWQFSEAKGRYIDSPLVVNDLIIAPNADYSIYALDLKGNLKWTFKGGNGFWTKPVSDGKAIYVPSMDHYIYALDVNTGDLIWKTDLKAPAVARAVIDEQGVIFLGNLNGEFFALNSADGSTLWETKVSGGVWAAPILHEGKLYFGDQSGNINIIESADGKLDQYVQTDGAILGSGALFGEGMAFGNESGSLTLIGFNGEKLWPYTVDGKIYANLQTNGTHLIVIVNSGEKPLVALDAKGNESWYFSTK